jgi:hypothetical protein
VRPNSLKYDRIIHGIVDLMKKLEKQGLFHKYAHQDENKACIDKAAKLLDEAVQRFEVSLQPFLLYLSAHGRPSTPPDEHANQYPSQATMYVGCAC